MLREFIGTINLYQMCAFVKFCGIISVDRIVGGRVAAPVMPCGSHFEIDFLGMRVDVNIGSRNRLKL